MSQDPDEPEGLTPNHFLIGRTNQISDQSKYFAYLYWGYWLHELNEYEWTESAAVSNGIVFIADKNDPSGGWPKWIVAVFYLTKNGVVWLADIRTTNCTLTKLCALEQNCNENVQVAIYNTTGKDVAENTV